MTKLVKASIVIVANVHNPSIVSPEWLKKFDFIKEEPLQFIHTPDFSAIETEIFNLIADRQRLQITLKRINKKNLLFMMKLVQKYVEILPHIPFRSLGLNFDWLIEKFDENKLPHIQLNVGNIKNFKEVFPGHNVNFGLRIFAIKKPYALKLTVDPTSKNTLICMFNYHHEVVELSADIIVEYLNQIEELYTNSKEITDRISKGEI